MRTAKVLVINLLFVFFGLLVFFGLPDTTYAQQSTRECTIMGSEKPYTEGQARPDKKKICKNGRWVCNPGGQLPNGEKVCCGIKLNTNVPFIGKCISTQKTEEDGTVVTQTTAFPILMGGLTKIMMTLIFAVSFLMVIAGGVMMVIGGAKQEYYKKGIKLIKTVIIALAVLGSSGVVLKLINPNFFGI